MSSSLHFSSRHVVDHVPGFALSDFGNLKQMYQKSIAMIPKLKHHSVVPIVYATNNERSLPFYVSNKKPIVEGSSYCVKMKLTSRIQKLSIAVINGCYLPKPSLGTVKFSRL